MRQPQTETDRREHTMGGTTGRVNTRRAVATASLVATLGVGTGMVAAAVPSGASAKPQATVTLKFWNAYNTVTETPVLNKIVIPEFEKLNPGIKVLDVN